MNSFPVASREDIRRIEQQPYTAFMAHRTVYAALCGAAQRHGTRPALTAIDRPDDDAPVRRWTHAELLADVRRAAQLFAQCAGAEPPRVVLLLPPVPEAYIALWGAETAGVACPINPALDAGHIAALVRACGANLVVALGPVPDLDIWPRAQAVAAQCPQVKALFAVGGAPGAPDFAAELARHDGERLQHPQPEDETRLAALFHTGGTTGAPKLAQHLHRNQLHAAWGAAQMYGSRETDVVLNGFPLFHVAGSFVYGLSTLLSGGELVLPTRLGLRNAAFMARFGHFVQRHGVTLLAAVPTVMAALVALPLERAELAGVRALLTGGSPLPDELAAAFEQRHGIPVRNILGMTECAGVIAIEPLAGPRTPGSCGLPLPFTEVQALRADGQPAGVGEPGILRVRGPHVSPGYTDAARNPGTFEDGWLVSGDIGHVDAEGRVFVTGRAKDVIIRGAHNIDPGVIESALLRHPEVQMAAAVGAPDAYAGELPVAFVVLVPGSQADPAAILAAVAPHIGERAAWPKRLEVLEALPLTAIGKVYKPALRARATQQVLQELLAGAGLGARVQARVDDSAAGLVVRFTVDDNACEAPLRELMKPFALAYELRSQRPA